MPAKGQKKRDIQTSDALITGFPGFLATHLLHELMERQPSANFHLLIEGRFRDTAEQRLAKLREEHPGYEGVLELYEGDITRERLGLTKDVYQNLTSTVGVVWHLAAIYNLAVPEQIAYRVNVRGTCEVLDFCEACENFLQLNYVSTCYVAGQRRGTVYEDELDEGQSHNNHYESTKFWAEVEVQRRSGEIPTAIFRPAIVVGHSQTGETDKYDGPYYLLKALKRFPDWLPFPNLGRGDAEVNIVPVDFVAEAMAYLGLRTESQGEVFQLADPNPLKADEIVELALKGLGKAPSFGRLPNRMIGTLLKSEKVEELVGLPRQTAAYFDYDARYDTTNAQRALADSAIRCPHLSSYLQTIIDYFEMHPEKEFPDGRRI